MKGENLFSSKSSGIRPGADESDLLQDLQNLIVTDDNESLQEMLSIIGTLQAKLEDRQGLVNLLKPVIVTVLEENLKEDPLQLQKILRPIVDEILQEKEKQKTEHVYTRKHGLQRLSQSIKANFQKMFSIISYRQKQIVKEIPTDSKQNLQIHDGDFALFELFLLAKPSLVLLAHGSWRSPDLQTSNQEQILPLLRNFIEDKTKDKGNKEPLKAYLDKFQIHIEPSKYSYLIVFYEGNPPIGFFLDVRQTLADIQNRYVSSLKRAQSITPYRSILRLLLDRYRPSKSRLGDQAQNDPLKWPPSKKRLTER